MNWLPTGDIMVLSTIGDIVWTGLALGGIGALAYLMEVWALRLTGMWRNRKGATDA